MKIVAVIMSVLVLVGLTFASIVPFLGGDDPSSTTAGSQGTAATPPPAAEAPTAASAQVCATEAAQLAQAEEIAHGIEGRYLDGPGLVAAGYLDSAPAGHAITSADGFATYRLVPVGACAAAGPAGPPTPSTAAP